MTEKKARRKIAMPNDLNEVDSNIAEIGSIDRYLATEKARLEATFDRLRTQCLERLAADMVRRDDLLKGIAKYAKKNRKEILPADRKSIELLSGTFGWRLDPWKVVVAGEEETVINWLIAEKKPKFLRHKVELNREVLIEEKPENIPGISFNQNERFFIEPKQEAIPEGKCSVVQLARVA